MDNIWANLIVIIFVNILMAIKSIHMMQLNSYNVDQEILWYKKNIKKFIPQILLLISSLILLFDIFKINAFNLFLNYFNYLVLLVILIENMPHKEKKKLVWTKRAIRLFVAILILVFLLISIILFINYSRVFNLKEVEESINITIEHLYYITTTKVILELLVLTSLAPILNLLSFLFMTPIENHFRNNFVKEAKAILDSDDKILKIGITGSFGKTSVKYYLDELLKIKYNVCKTKGSFNTPMGATLTIKNDLKSIDEIFLCEMGARRLGDIKEMCDLVNPTIGIITDCWYQHLDTFKNIDNVLKTKFELLDSIIKANENKNSIYNKKLVLINGDNELIKKHIENNYKKEKEEKVIKTYGYNLDNDYIIKIEKIDEEGLEFEIYDKIKDTKIKSITQLIGEHNLMNLTCAIALATNLNVSYEDIKRATIKIKPVEHRLELKKINEKTILIDDCYNSNIKGVKYAIDSIKNFKDYEKIIITPGIVELGEKQFEENRNFGKMIGENLDKCFIIGETNKNALEEGLKETSIKEDNICFLKDVQEAINMAFKMNIKKVILIENDLPENY